MPTLDEVINAAAESIWVHNASGHFTAEVATARLVALGLTEEAAAALLRRPVDDALFSKYRTWPAAPSLPETQEGGQP